MSMSDSLSQDEKRRLLRERRQAKMNAKASDRLNTILTSGSSVKETVTSPLDKKVPAERTHEHLPVKSVSVPAVSLQNDDDDPEDIDISAHGTPQPQAFAGGAAAPGPEDFDAMLNKLFGAGPSAGGPGGDSAADGDMDPFAKMMQMLGSGDGAGVGGMFPGMAGANDTQDQPASLYQAKLGEYYAYQQKKNKSVFFAVRYFTTLVNFLYHYYTSLENTFQSSSQASIRQFEFSKSNFFSWFITFEVGILATYFFIVSNSKYVASDSSLILKGISMISMFLPQLQAYRPLIVRLMSYWEVLSMFLGDIALVTILFGLTSYLG